MEIVGAIPDVASDHHRLFFIPLPILGVGDVYWIVMAAFRVIDNEADRCIVSTLIFVCDLLKLMELRATLSASSSGNGAEQMASWGGVVDLSGVFSGGERSDGVGEGDFGGVVGCTNSVKPVVEDMIWEEWWMTMGA